MTSFATIAASLVRSKVAAVYLGPGGVGVAAELLQLSSLGLVPLAAISGPALVHGLSRERRDGVSGLTTAAALTWTLLLGVSLSFGLTLGARWLYPGQWTPNLYALLVFGCVNAIATAIVSVAIQMMVFEGWLGTTTRLQLGSTIVAAVLAASLTMWLGLAGQFIALAVAPIAVLPFVVKAARASSFWPRKGIWALDSNFLASAFRYGAASLVAATAIQGSLYVIRLRLEDVGGSDFNGQFQAAWAIGATYLGVILNGIGSFAFPRFAAANSSEALQQEVDATARFVVRVATPVVLLAVTFGGVAVRLLYSERFDGAVEILTWQLAGDAAKCLSWVYAGPLLFRGRLRAFIATEALAAILLAGLSWVLIPSWGPEGAGAAYLITYLIHLPVAAATAQLSLNVRPWHIGIIFALGLSVALAIIAHVGMTVPVGAVTTTLAIVWAWRAGLLHAGLQRIVSLLRRLFAQPQA